MSIFASVVQAPPDPILSLAALFKEDKDPNKVNLGVGAYRTEEGKPWILPSVRTAELDVVQDPAADKEYVPIDGKPEHKKGVQQLCFSDEEVEKGSIATAQALSGTGALQMVGQFLLGQLGIKDIYLPDPTWGNHTAIFKRAGLTPHNYTYYHPATRGFDFAGMMTAIDAMPEGSAILLHSCAQNPTGVDPNEAQWQEIVNKCKEKKLVPVIDNAYQGYASGDLAKDGLSQTLFEKSGMEYFITQSFAKNLGLYGERIGYIHIRCADKVVAAAALSQLKILIRQAYSSPPRHGAAIVHKILSTPELKKQWLGELTFMSNRILSMRKMLRDALEKRATPGTWNHITDQIGMFSYTGLDTAQVQKMVGELHIYMTKDGRISMAGVNPGNVDYIADCIHKVVAPAAAPPAATGTGGYNA